MLENLLCFFRIANYVYTMHQNVHFLHICQCRLFIYLLLFCEIKLDVRYHLVRLCGQHFCTFFFFCQIMHIVFCYFLVCPFTCLKLNEIKTILHYTQVLLLYLNPQLLAIPHQLTLILHQNEKSQYHISLCILFIVII